jgi:hypothetical protein
MDWIKFTGCCDDNTKRNKGALNIGIMYSYRSGYDSVGFIITDAGNWYNIWDCCFNCIILFHLFYNGGLNARINPIQTAESITILSTVTKGKTMKSTNEKQNHETEIVWFCIGVLTTLFIIGFFLTAIPKGAL